MAAKDVKLIILLASLLVVAGAGATGSLDDGCISRNYLKTSTFQDEMEMWVCRHGKDVTVTVEHSKGSCELRINDPVFDAKWLQVKLNLTDNIELFVNGTRIAPSDKCEKSLKMNTIKTISVDNAEQLIPDCHEGPAIYQISKNLDNILIPWYEEEARLLLELQNDTQIEIEIGGKEFIVCFNGTHAAALQNPTACTAGVGTPAITLIVPKSNEYIMVNTSDGKEAETQITNAVPGAPLTVKKTLINGTVIMKQCMPNCNTAKDVPKVDPKDTPEVGPTDIPEVGPTDIPDDGSSNGYYTAMVIFLLLSIGLSLVVAYLVFRIKRSGYSHQRPEASHPDDAI